MNEMFLSGTFNAVGSIDQSNCTQCIFGLGVSKCVKTRSFQIYFVNLLKDILASKNHIPLGCCPLGMCFFGHILLFLLYIVEF